MDPLRRDDIELARGTSPEERARQTLEMMFGLPAHALHVQYPRESEEQIEQRFRSWLEGEGDEQP